MAHKISVLLRGLFKEFQHLSTGIVEENARFSWRYVPAYSEVKEEFHQMKNSTNNDDIKDCLLKCELYSSYLKAVRRENELEDKYKGVGERPIEELAASVGLKLPEKYQDKRDS